MLARAESAPAVNALSASLRSSVPSALLPVILGQVRTAVSAVLVMDNVGVVVDDQGNPKGNTLLFPSPPLRLATMPPYAVALLPDSRLVVYHVGQGTAMQAVQLPTSWGQQGGAASATGFNLGLGFLSGAQPSGSFSPTSVSLAAVSLMESQAVALAASAEVRAPRCVLHYPGVQVGFKAVETATA